MPHTNRTATLLRAISLLAVAAAGCEAARHNPGGVGESSAALTSEQCSYFASGDKVTICHSTSSAKHPYTIIKTNVASCGGHSDHSGDYVALGDPTCSGQGCFPDGAPFDGSVECCEGLVVVNGRCTDLCKDVVCTASDQCHVAGTCDPATGACSNPAAGDDTPCDDGNPGTVSDACFGGACIGQVAAADGCSDGTREGFADATAYPAIAACSGGWSIPGIRTSNTVSPACGRVSGNSSSNPSGAGCNVADLCSAGWHVCLNSDEVASKSNGNNCRDAMVDDAFFAQREASSGFFNCFDSGDLDTVQNDIWGCAGTGTLMSGLQIVTPCPRFGPGAGVLNANTHDDCSGIAPPWSCSGSSLREAAIVTKSSPDRGGVLCCRD